MRVIRTILGMLMLTIGIPSLLVGAGCWTAMQHRDAGGAFGGELQRLATPGYAVVVDDLDGLLRHDASFARIGESQLRVTAMAQDGPAFIGIAPAAQARQYLTGVPHATVSSIDIGTGALPVATRPVAGVRAPAVLPGAESFWTRAGAGSLDWNPADLPGGPYSLIIMSRAAQPGLHLTAGAEIRPSWLNSFTWALLMLGSLLLVGGLIVLGWPGRRREIVYVVEPSQVPELMRKIGAPPLTGRGGGGRHAAVNRPRTLADAVPKVAPPALPQFTWPPAKPAAVLSPDVAALYAETPSAPVSPAPAGLVVPVPIGVAMPASAGVAMPAPAGVAVPAPAPGEPLGLIGNAAGSAAAPAPEPQVGRGAAEKTSRRRVTAVAETPIFEASAVGAWVAETAAARVRERETKARAAAAQAAAGRGTADGAGAEVEAGRAASASAGKVATSAPAASPAPVPAAPVPAVSDAAASDPAASAASGAAAEAQAGVSQLGTTRLSILTGPKATDWTSTGLTGIAEPASAGRPVPGPAAGRPVVPNPSAPASGAHAPSAPVRGRGTSTPSRRKSGERSGPAPVQAAGQDDKLGPANGTGDGQSVTASPAPEQSPARDDESVAVSSAAARAEQPASGSSVVTAARAGEPVPASHAPAQGPVGEGRRSSAVPRTAAATPGSGGVPVSATTAPAPPRPTTPPRPTAPARPALPSPARPSDPSRLAPSRQDPSEPATPAGPDRMPSAGGAPLAGGVRQLTPHHVAEAARVASGDTPVGGTSSASGALGADERLRAADRPRAAQTARQLAELGKSADQLTELARSIDERPVSTERSDQRVAELKQSADRLEELDKAPPPAVARPQPVPKSKPATTSKQAGTPNSPGRLTELAESAGRLGEPNSSPQPATRSTVVASSDDPDAKLPTPERQVPAGRLSDYQIEAAELLANAAARRQRRTTTASGLPAPDPENQEPPIRLTRPLRPGLSKPVGKD
jgi:hypothetical protein